MSENKLTNLPPHLQQDMKIAAIDYSESLEVPVIEEIAAEDAFNAGGKAMYSFILQELGPVVEALRNYDYDSNGKPAREALKHLKERVLNGNNP